MTMFMGIVGHVLSLDDGRHQDSPGLRGCNGQSHASIYLMLDQVSTSLQAHYCGHSSMSWSDRLEDDIQLEFDFVDDPEHVQLASMPTAAECLICFFLRNDECEWVIGDLNERYCGLHKVFGKRKADRYLYRELCRSLVPFIKRALAKSSVRILLDEWIRKLTA